MYSLEEETSAAHLSATVNEKSSSEHAPKAPVVGGAQAVLNLQRTIGNAGVVQLLKSDEDPHGLQRVMGSGGSPLDSKSRTSMESAFNTDFSDVRVHTGGDAEQSAKSLGAHAYTAGNNVVFGSGYDPDSAAGQKTLAHELTHVVQQRSGPVDGTATETGVKLSSPSDRFEQAAESTAEQVMSTGSASADTTPSTANVQRHSAGEEEVQGLFIQREAEAPAEEEQEEVQGMFIQREGESPEEEEEPAQ